MVRSGLKLMLICCVIWGGNSSLSVKSIPTRDVTVACARGGLSQVGGRQLPARALQRVPLTQDDDFPDDDSPDEPLPDDTPSPMAVDSEQECETEETVGQHEVALDQGAPSGRHLAKSTVNFHLLQSTCSFAPLRI